MRISEVLRSKGSAVTTARTDNTVDDILALFAKHNIGAVVITDGDDVVGIVSERDVVRGLHQLGTDTLHSTAGEVMTSPVVTCSPEDTVDDLSRVMTERRFRHLPVVEDGTLLGIVSIGDVVKHRVAQLEADREQLESYIVQG